MNHAPRGWRFATAGSKAGRRVRSSQVGKATPRLALAIVEATLDESMMSRGPTIVGAAHRRTWVRGPPLGVRSYPALDGLDEESIRWGFRTRTTETL